MALYLFLLQIIRLQELHLHQRILSHGISGALCCLSGWVGFGKLNARYARPGLRAAMSLLVWTHFVDDNETGLKRGALIDE